MKNQDLLLLGLGIGTLYLGAKAGSSILSGINTSVWRTEDYINRLHWGLNIPIPFSNDFNLRLDPFPYIQNPISDVQVAAQKAMNLLYQATGGMQGYPSSQNAIW